MKIRCFKTYSDNYINFNIFPTISIEYFENCESVVFVGWGVLGFQITYKNYD